MVRKSKKKGNKTGPKMPDLNDWAKRVYKLSLLGLKDTDMALILGISKQTFESYKRKSFKFRDAIDQGKKLADAEVARALYHKAIGYSHEDTEIKVVSNGGKMGSEIVEVPVIKHYPPDTQAAIFWLTNRDRDNWEYTTSINHKGKVKVEHSQPDLSNLSDEELRILEKMTNIDELVKVEDNQLS